MICLLALCRRHLSRKLDMFLLLTHSNPVSNLHQSERSDRVHSAERTTSWRRSPRGRSADDPGQRSQADDDKRWYLGGSLMEQTANFDRERIPYGRIRRQSCCSCCFSPLARCAGHGQHLAVGGRCPTDRTAPRTTPTQSYGPRSGPSRLGRYTTPLGPSTTRESSSGACWRGRQPATSTGSATSSSISSGEPVAGWPTSTVRSGDTPRVTAADDSGYESDKAEVHLLGPMSRMCRGDSRLVRRLKAGTQRATGAEERGHGSKGSNV
jgi:hypothetical protein